MLKESSPEYSLEDWCWSWSSNTLTTWCKELTRWKRPWWERLKAGGEGDDRGWHGWMASLTQWTWVWASSGNWWWIGKPGLLQSMGLISQTWPNDWTELKANLDLESSSQDSQTVSPTTRGIWPIIAAMSPLFQSYANSCSFMMKCFT